jgi:hypothetical protein
VVHGRAHLGVLQVGDAGLEVVHGGVEKLHAVRQGDAVARAEEPPVEVGGAVRKPWRRRWSACGCRCG